MKSPFTGNSLSFYAFNIKSGSRLTDYVRRIISGLDYYRCLEYPLVYNACLGLAPNGPVLDVGSGSGLFPLMLAKAGRFVHATDPDSELVLRLQRVAYGLNLPNGRLTVETQDARRLTYRDHFFHQVTCISTIEHIRGEGDVEASREMARLLAPGGKFFLTVPFSKTYHEHEGGPHVAYFERRYDKQQIMKRLVEPSGLTVKEVQYFGHTGFRFGHYWYRLPRILRGLLGWSIPFFSSFFLTLLDGEDTLRADGVFIIFEKPS